MNNEEKILSMLEQMQSNMGMMQSKMDQMQSDISGLKTGTSGLTQDITDIKQEVTKTNMTIENEIQPNIHLLAEGHIGLVERLDRIEGKVEEIDDIKDTVSVLKLITVKGK